MSIKSPSRPIAPASDNIIFRHYRPGDEIGLAEVFNRAFQGLGGGFLRTPRMIRWRYVTNPGADPNEIQVAEDITTGKIVGSVFSTIDHYRFLGKKYIVGAINDVGTMPGYGGKGIARKLMDQAIAFMDQRKCAFSVLSADPSGHPREKIYLRCGYRDYLREMIAFRITNPIVLLRFFPMMILTLPAFTCLHIFHRIRAQKNFNAMQKRGYTIKIIHPWRNHGFTRTNSRAIYQFLKEFGSRYMNGYEPMSEAAWEHFRERVYSRDFQPSYCIIRKGSEIVAVGSFVKQWFKSTMLGLKGRIAQPRDLCINLQCSTDPEEIALICQALVDGLVQSAIERGSMALLFSFTENWAHFRRALRIGGFLTFPAGVFMMRTFPPDQELPAQNNKPFFVNPGENFGSP
jgi:ribosomal protein S18 acetylase RimI-like enzyme